MTTYSIGFTKTSAQSFFTRLTSAGVVRLLDVRLNNVSQLAGFAKRDDLRYFLDVIGDIEYRHVPALAPTKDMLRSYQSKEISWPEYSDQYLQLLASRHVELDVSADDLHDACLLCSEHEPSKCHRRLALEYLAPDSVIHL